MRAYIPGFAMESPKSLPEALELLNTKPGQYLPFAGGTDLMVLVEAGLLKEAQFVDLSYIPELRGIEVTGSTVTLKAMTNYGEIQEHEVLRQEFPNLCEAASLTGSIAIQNRGTIAGNIANASPAGDSLPALLAYDAALEITGSKGMRKVPYRDFHLGYKKMDLKAGELVTAVALPRSKAPLKHFYRKVGTRKAQAISKVVFAGVGRNDGGRLSGIHFAIGSVGPKPLYCGKTCAALEGQVLGAALQKKACEVLMQEITPIDDIRSTEAYRFEVTGNIFEQFLKFL